MVLIKLIEDHKFEVAYYIIPTRLVCR